MPGNDPTWNVRDPASKERVLTVLQRELDEMFDLVADSARWEAPTACEAWETRDVVGHLVDTTEGYGYARMNGGTARGDQELAGRFRGLFFPI